jgi:hypothetical protein
MDTVKVCFSSGIGDVHGVAPGTDLRKRGKEIHPFHDGKVKHTPHRAPQNLGVGKFDRSFSQENSTDPEPVTRPDDGTKVSRVCNGVEGDEHGLSSGSVQNTVQ